MKKLKFPSMLIIFGPTATGKTECALEIAQQLPAEIINMDVGQFYSPFTIGTAKPDWRSLKIPHHLFDILEEPRNLTVVQYRELIKKTVNEIWQRGNLPIIVGGSGFYLKSLFFPPQAAVTYDAKLETYYPPSTDLWLELYKIDPKRAQEIHKEDTYRIKRALAIWHKTGRLPSEYVPVYEPLAPFEVICLMRERLELYRRINDRVMLMIEKGWIQEVEQLVGTDWEHFIKEKKLIGYNEFLAYTHSDRTKDSLEKTLHIIKKRTRNYAKRQLTFWRMFEKDIRTAHAHSTIDPSGWQSGTHTVNLTLVDLHLYINELLRKLSVLFK